MATCKHCGTLTGEHRRDPDSDVFPCRKCGEDLNETSEAPGKPSGRTTSDGGSDSTVERRRVRREPVHVDADPTKNKTTNSSTEINQAPPPRKSRIKEKYCPACNARVFMGEEICEDCGASLKEPSSSTPKTVQTTSAPKPQVSKPPIPEPKPQPPIVDTEEDIRQYYRQQIATMEGGYYTNLTPYGFCWGAYYNMLVPFVSGNVSGGILFFVKFFALTVFLSFIPILGVLISPLATFLFSCNEIPKVTAQRCSYNQEQYDFLFGFLDKLGKLTMAITVIVFVVTLFFTLLIISVG